MATVEEIIFRGTDQVSQVEKNIADNAKSMSKDLTDAGNAGVAASDKQTKASNVFQQTVRAERQEHRMRGFAIREGSAAIGQMSDVMVGPNGLTKSLQKGAGQLFEMDFAINLVANSLKNSKGETSEFGKAIGKAAIPIAIAIGAIVMLTDKIRQNKADIEKYRGEIDKLLAERSGNTTEQIKVLDEQVTKLIEKDQKVGFFEHSLRGLIGAVGFAFARTGDGLKKLVSTDIPGLHISVTKFLVSVGDSVTSVVGKVLGGTKTMGRDAAKAMSEDAQARNLALEAGRQKALNEEKAAVDKFNEQVKGSNEKRIEAENKLAILGMQKQKSLRDGKLADEQKSYTSSVAKYSDNQNMLNTLAVAHATKRAAIAKQFDKKISDEAIASFKKDRDQQLAVLDRVFEEEKKKNVGNKDAIDNITKEHTAKRATIMLEAEQKIRDEKDKEVKKAEEVAGKIERLGKETAEASIGVQKQMLLSYAKTEEQKLDIEYLFAKQKLDIDEKVALAGAGTEEEQLAITKKYTALRLELFTKFGTDVTKQQEDTRKKQEKMQADTAVVMHEAEMTINETYMAREKHQIEEQTKRERATILADTTLTEEEKQADILRINEATQKKLKELNTKTIVDFGEMIYAQISIIESSISSMISAGYDAQIAEVERAQTETDKSFQDIIDNENMSAEQHKAATEAKKKADAEYADKVRLLKQQQWQSDHDWAVAQAIANGAVAVSKAWAELGPLGYAGAALVSAAVAAQVAVIMSQKMPKFHEGGVVPGPKTQEYPILVRGGETVRTEAQERSLKKNANGNVYVTFNSPVPHAQWVKQSIEEGISRTGLSVNDYFVTTNKGITWNN